MRPSVVDGGAEAQDAQPGWVFSAPVRLRPAYWRIGPALARTLAQSISISWVSDRALASVAWAGSTISVRMVMVPRSGEVAEGLPSTMAITRPPPIETTC